MEILQARQVPIEYTCDQQDALLKIQKIIDERDDKNQFFLLEGYAGTGKTTIVENIVRYALIKQIKTRIVAPTNKAAMVITEKLKTSGLTDVMATTIHSLIYKRKNEKTGKWELREHVSGDILIIDESSMVDSRMLEDIRQVIARKCIVIFIGDSFQLPPVGNDPRLFEWKNYNPLNKIIMTTVTRQVLTSDILKIATVIRCKKQLMIPGFASLDFKMVTREEYKGNIHQDIMNHENMIAITSDNTTRVKHNLALHKKKFGSDIVCPGESLMCIGNSDSYKNGETFTLRDIESIDQFDIDTIQETLSGYRIVAGTDYGESVIYLFPEYPGPTLSRESFSLPRFPGDVLRKDIRFFRGQKWLEKYVVIATYGYCITAHKSQGSQWDKVYVFQERVGYDSSRWLYTAITRACKEVILVENDSYNKISKKETDEICRTLLTNKN